MIRRQRMGLLALLFLAIPCGRGTGAEFKALPTGTGATTMSITEDGAFLLVAHEDAGKVAVWDVKAQKVVKTLSCAAPRFILCRGSKAYVANYGKGTITVFDAAKDWALVDEVLAGHPQVYFLSAPAGKHFKGTILTSCGRYALHAFHAVDMARDQAKKVREEVYASVATASYDGKHVVLQGEFRMSPSATPKAIGMKSFLAEPRGKGARGDHDSTPLLYQVREGAWWFGEVSVYTGIPPRHFGEPQGEWVIPDVTRPLFYVLDKDVVTTYALVSTTPKLAAPKLATTKVKAPAAWAEKRPRIFKGRRRVSTGLYGNYHFHYPLAVTHGTQTHLFIYDEGPKTVVQCTLKAVDESALAVATKPPPPPPPPPPPAGPEKFPKLVCEGKAIRYPLFEQKVKGTFVVAKGPAGVAVSPEGELRWTPTAKDSGPQRIKIRAEIDGKISFMRIETEVAAETTPAQARAKAFPPKVGIGKKLTFRLYEGKVKGKFSLVQGPKTIRISGDGGLTWTPSVEEKGPHRITIKAVIDGKASVVNLGTVVVAAPTTVPAETPKLADAENFPKRVLEGRKIAFELFARPVQGAFALVEGPKGVAISAAGKLEWTPSARDRGPQRLRIRAEIGGDISFIRIGTEVISKETAKLADGDLARLDDLGVHYIVSGGVEIVRSASRDRVVVRMGRKLLVLDAGGLTVTRSGELGDLYARVAERPDYYVAARNGALRLLDKKTLKPKREIKLPGSNVTDLALHPSHRACYVAIEDNEGGRLNPVLAKKVAWVDETRGKVKFLDRTLGQWLAVHPSGKYLFTGTHEMYQAGYRFDAVVRDFLHDYEHIDIVLSYDIEGDRARHRHTNARVGTNGRALRMAPDGGHVSYVSGGGYPGEGYTIPALNADDIRTLHVTYRLGPYPRDIAFHPVLDLVACTGGGTPGIYNRKTGEALANKLDLGDRKLGGVGRLHFTPDGKRLLIECSDQTKRRALRSFALRLTDAERQQLDKAPRKRPVHELVDADDRDERPRTVVPLADLDGLRAASTTEMDARAIARAFMNSVVIIKSDDGGGTGFVVGSKGYVLTCAHVLPIIGDPEVTYRTERGGRVVMRTAKAEIVSTDKRLDLALLKIEAAGALPVVRLDAGRGLEAGESICTIGHPGLGRKILDYTMTQGIISNPARDIEGQPYIQTNATVNPGSSGSPLFDSRGNVVGLVVLKASIENTGFAVPVARLVRFVRSHARGSSAPRPPARVAETEPKPASDPDAARKCRSWLSMAKGFKKAGKKDKAREYLEKILREYPGSTFADEAKAMMADR